MSSYYGITGTSDSSTSSFFSSMLGSSSSSTGSSSSLTDYAMIRNGSYKKLLKAYYAKEETTKTESETKAEKVNLTSAKTDASSLASASSKLVGASYTEENRDEIVSAIKSYVEAYNEVIKGSDDVDDTAVLRNTLWLTQQTSAHEDTLKKLGITIKEGNTLSLNEETLKAADLGTMKTLFSGYASYGSYVAGKASQISAAAGSALKALSGSAYTSKGSYTASSSGSVLDTTT